MPNVDNRKVVIMVGENNVMEGDNIASGVNLVLEQDFSLNLSSSFKPLYSSGGNDLATFIGSITRDSGGPAFSGQFKQFGAQIWQNTEPINFTMDFTFYRGMTEAYDAKTEVYEPMKALMKLPLPSEGGTVEVGGANVTNLIAPGPSFLDVLGLSGQNSKVISISIGRVIAIPQIVVKRAQPTYSKDVDAGGYPIWGKINLEISSLFTATTSMIDRA